VVKTYSDSPNRFLEYTDLHYIPEEEKNEVWASSCLIFSKYNSRPLVTDDQATKFRNIDRGIINAQEYKNVFDPIDPITKDGGKADFVAADWKSNPINIHINNIVATNMEKIPLNLFCKATDEFAMLKQQKENHRILGRKEFMNFLNEMNAQLGIPKLKPTDDPYAYADRMKKANTPEAKTGRKVMGVMDAPTGLLESLKAAIDDNEGLALFNEFIYKGDVEIAIELGLQYYFKKNKFPRVGERLIADIRNFNRGCGRWYTSLTTGRPIIEYLDPVKVHTSDFHEPDGKDVQFWLIEYDVTFGDFVKMVGRGLTKEQLKKVFERNKANFAMHGFDWSRCSTAQRYSAKIRIGYHEWLTQNCEVYSEGNINGNESYRKKPFNWKPSTNTIKKYKTVRKEKHYNVWYKCYYIPLKNFDANSGAMQISEFLDQSEYIFDFGKIQDQQRYGDDDRNALCSLVIWKGSGMSFAEIQDRFMPKIHYQWQKYQNYSSQNDVHKIYSNKMIEQMMAISDEADKKSTLSKMEWLKMLEQTGKGVADTTDSQGHEIKAIQYFKTGYAEAALECLTQIQTLYNLMTVALSISDTREGIDPKPRTSLGGIQRALEGSNNGTFFIEKGYMDMTMEFANRMMYYMNSIVEENDSERLQEFKDIVGQANGLAYEAIGDIPKHRLGMFIENVNTDEQKQYLLQLADSMVKAGQMDVEALSLIVKVENYKYAAVLMILKYKQKQKELAAKAEKEFQQQMQIKEMDLKIQQAGFQAKEEAKTISIDREKQWDMKIAELEGRLRAQTQAMIKDITGNNRIAENEAKANAEKEKAA
jgi:hypothetical protein